MNLSLRSSMCLLPVVALSYSFLACSPLDQKLRPVQQDTSVRLLNVDQGSDLELARAAIGWTQEAVTHINLAVNPDLRKQPLAFKSAPQGEAACASVVNESQSLDGSKTSFGIQFAVQNEVFNTHTDNCETETDNVKMGRGGSLSFSVFGRAGELPSDISVYSGKGEVIYLKSAVNNKDKATVSVVYNLEAKQIAMPEAYKNLGETHVAYSMDLFVETRAKINFKTKLEDGRTNFALQAVLMVAKATRAVTLLQIDPTNAYEHVYSGLVTPKLQNGETMSKDSVQLFYGSTRMQFLRDVKTTNCGAIVGEMTTSFVDKKPKAGNNQTPISIDADPEKQRQYIFDETGIRGAESANVKALGACVADQDALALAIQRIYYR